MSGVLTRETILELFDALNEKLRTATERAEVYIVGGAAVALAHNAERTTDDVDGYIRRGSEAVSKAAREIAEERGLSKYWLNDAVTMRHLPSDPDPNERTLYDNTNLTITGASLNRLIAMKLHAGRATDLADLNVLLDEAGVQSGEDARRIHRLTYGLESEMDEDADLYLIKRYASRTRADGASESPKRPPVRGGGTAPGGTAVRRTEPGNRGR